jgi:hypothetical protein
VLSRLALVTVSLVAFVACNPTPSPEPSAPSAAVPSGTAAAATSAPGPTAEPGPSILLTCGGEERFQSAALAGVGLAEFENDAAAAVLKSILAEPVDPDIFPDHGWHRVAAGPGGVLFVAPGQGVPWVRVAAMPAANGWTADLYGECQAQPAMPGGIGLADFWLDPAAGRPGPDATTVSGFIRERSCAGGQPPEGRIQAPVVVVDERSVVITVSVRQQPGGQDCPANPDSAPITIELGQPLGGRVVLDGSVFPPRDASVPPA